MCTSKKDTQKNVVLQTHESPPLGNYLMMYIFGQNIIPMAKSGNRQDLWNVLVGEIFTMLLVIIIKVNISRALTILQVLC